MLVVVGVGVVLGLIALPIFQPWKLFVDRTVNEDLPTAAAPTAPSAAPSDSTGAAAPPQAAAAGPVALASGAFVSQEHPTTGTATVYRLADGRRILRLTDFQTSDGPDVHVWLTDTAVQSGVDGWYVFDDGAYTDLGPLKGNIGDQNYEVPDGVDLTAVRSVSIWCARFKVSFGAADLSPA